MWLCNLLILLSFLIDIRLHLAFVELAYFSAASLWLDLLHKNLSWFLLWIFCTGQMLSCHPANIVKVPNEKLFDRHSWYLFCLLDVYCSPFSALTLLLGDIKGIWPVKSCVMVCYWSFAHLITPAVATISIILSSGKIQNGDVLLPANPGPCFLFGGRRGMAELQCWKYVLCGTYCDVITVVVIYNICLAVRLFTRFMEPGLHVC